MQLFHVRTKYDGKIELPEELLEDLPKELILAGTVQFREQIPDVKEQLEQAGKEVKLFRSVHGQSTGQMLGCDIFETGGDADGFFYLGDGVFHPTAFLYENQIPVYYYNPFTEETTVMTEEDLEDVKKKKKGSLAKFFSSDNIGVIASTKPGQNNFPGALELKKRIEETDKGPEANVYIFLSQTLDIEELDNFPFIDCWVNTACPRIIEDTDKPMINLWDLRDTVMENSNISVV